VLFFTCLFAHCQLLCNTRANIALSRRIGGFTSDSALPLQPGSECSSFRFWDETVPTLGRSLSFSSLTSKQASTGAILLHSAGSYLVAVPGSGGQPIGRKSRARERFGLH
jgi:hypothetical protein